MLPQLTPQISWDKSNKTLQQQTRQNQHNPTKPIDDQYNDNSKMNKTYILTVMTLNHSIVI